MISPKLPIWIIYPLIGLKCTSGTLFIQFAFKSDQKVTNVQHYIITWPICPWKYENTLSSTIFFFQNPKIPSPAPTNHLLEKNFFIFFFPEKEWISMVFLIAIQYKPFDPKNKNHVLAVAYIRYCAYLVAYDIHKVTKLPSFILWTITRVDSIKAFFFSFLMNNS